MDNSGEPLESLRDPQNKLSDPQKHVWRGELSFGRHVSRGQVNIERKGPGGVKKQPFVDMSV